MNLNAIRLGRGRLKHNGCTYLGALNRRQGSLIWMKLSVSPLFGCVILPQRPLLGLDLLDIEADAVVGTDAKVQGLVALYPRGLFA